MSLHYKLGNKYSAKIQNAAIYNKSCLKIKKTNNKKKKSLRVYNNYNLYYMIENF